MKIIFSGTLLILLSGCAVIGVETIAPRESSPVSLSNEYRCDHSTSGYEIKNGTSLGFQHRNRNGENKLSVHLIDTNYNWGTPLDSPEKIITCLGEPDLKTHNVLRYETNKRNWRGIALDFAIFPIPLTIPLMIPSGRDGYVEFIFDAYGISAIHEYATTSKLYGIYYDGIAIGEIKAPMGTMSGIWFNNE